jgi:hypothetical protein
MEFVLLFDYELVISVVPGNRNSVVCILLCCTSLLRTVYTVCYSVAREI